MKNVSLLLLFFALFIGVSCEKERTARIQNDDIPLIAREIFSDDLYTEFTYNEQNLLIERKSKWVFNKYNYDAESRLTSMDLYEDPGIYSSNWETAEAAINRTEWVNPENTQKSTVTSYNYKNQIPESITVMRVSGETQYMSEFQWDDKGRIATRVYYSEGTPSGRIVYTYDIRGNVTKEEQYWNEELLCTRLYEFDNKHNPFKVFRHLLIPGIYTNENNIIKETQILAGNDDPDPVTVQVTESVYTYNTGDYPVLKNRDIQYEYK